MRITAIKPMRSASPPSETETMAQITDSASVGDVWIALRSFAPSSAPQLLQYLKPGFTFAPQDEQYISVASQKRSVKANRHEQSFRTKLENDAVKPLNRHGS